MQSKLFSISEIILITLFGVISTVCWGLYVGQDLGPDLINYHFYDAYLALHPHRLITDIFPAGIQGYLNPYIYVPVFLLYKILPPIGVGIVMSALHGSCFVASYIVAKVILANWSLVASRLMSFACAIFGTVNPFFLGMVGSSFSDNLTAPLILIPLALIMLIRFPANNMQISTHKFYVTLMIAGIMVGFSMGFKLVNCSYLLGFLVAWLYCFHFSKRDCLGAIVLFGAALVGFLVVNGDWMWRLYTNFQSPMFPFYNQIFKSKMIGYINTNVPAMAAAHSVYEFLSYPFQWAKGIPPPTEWNFKDARYAIFYVLIAALICWRVLPNLYKKIFRKRSEKYVVNKPDRYIKDRAWFIVIWAIVSYLFWIDQFGAFRYLMPFTLITGILLWLGVQALFFKRNIALIVWGGGALYTLLSMQTVYFGRMSWKQPWYPIPIPQKLQQLPNTLYIPQGGQSFVLPYLPNDAQFVGPGYLTWDAGITRRAQQIIDQHQGSIRTFDYLPTNQFERDQLTKFGLRRDPNDCVSFIAGVYPYMSCRAEKITKNLQPILIQLPLILQFNQPQNPWIDYTTGFNSPEPGGSWTLDKTVEIVFAGALPKKFNLSLMVSAIMGDNATLPIKIKIGQQEKEISFGKSLTASTSFNLGNSSVNKITILIPKPTSPHELDPKSGDTRKLGLLLNSLVLEPANLSEIDTPYLFNFAQGGNRHLATLASFYPPEPQGQWTEGKHAGIDIGVQLPNKFMLTITGSAFGPNIDLPIMLHIGSKTYKFKLSSTIQSISIPIALQNEKAKKLYFIIPKPTSPYELKQSVDQRKLGIFINSIQIVPIKRQNNDK